MQNELTENTVEWWLNQITDPIIRRLALGNIDSNLLDYELGSLYGVICSLRDWSATNEGRYFWKAIAMYNDPNITFESVKHLLPQDYKLTN